MNCLEKIFLSFYCFKLGKFTFIVIEVLNNADVNYNKNIKQYFKYND